MVPAPSQGGSPRAGASPARKGASLRPMRLTLFRHGHAVDRTLWTGEDADRPLTEDGRRRTAAMVASCAALIKAERILTSPFLRAADTAAIASKVWHRTPSPTPWLIPGAATAVERLALLAAAGVEDLVLVGHEPDLGELAGAAIGGPAVTLAKAGLLVLEGDPKAGGMALRLLLSPKAVGRLK